MRNMQAVNIHPAGTKPSTALTALNVFEGVVAGLSFADDAFFHFVSSA